MHRLTDVFINAIKPPPTGRAVYKDASSPLQLRVMAGGSKVFFTVVGNGRRHTIGRWGEVSLAQAREVARRVRAEKTLGRYASRSVPLKDAKEEYLLRLTVRPNTRRSYAHYLCLLNTSETRAITRLLDTMTPRVQPLAIIVSGLSFACFYVPGRDATRSHPFATSTSRTASARCRRA